MIRLQSLAQSPAEQAAFAQRLVAKERNPDVVIAALAVIEAQADERVRLVLHTRYAACARDGGRHDPGGAIRIALLRALRAVALPEDATLFTHAATTYEFGFGELAGDLRAAGLRGLAEVDPALVGFYAVRLLHDPHTSRMSGQPAVTAVQVLADLGQVLPLYLCATREGDLTGEVLGECLRGLAAIPASLVPDLIARYHEERDEIVLLGLFDLLLEHPARADFMPVVRDFLCTTTLIDLYRSIVATIIAGRDGVWLAELQQMAAEEKHPAKAAILKEAVPPR